MDALTHRLGIDHAGRLIHGDQTEPTQGERHHNRHLRAAATMTLTPAPLPTMEYVAADGRRGWPKVVVYEVKRGDATEQEYVPPAEKEVVYKAVVLDQAAYDQLRQRGLLDVGHRVQPLAPGA